jgi:hypothetical protein
MMPIGYGVCVDQAGGAQGVGVAVCVAVAVGRVPVGVGVAVGLAHEGKRNEPMRVCQLNAPVVPIYSVVNQKVQSSVGSTVMAL